MLKGGFLTEDGFGIAEHFKEPGFAVKGKERAEDGLGIARQAYVGGAVIGDGAGGGGLREVSVSDGGEPDLLAPAVYIGEESAHVAGEDRDGDGGGSVGTVVIEFGFANPGGGLFDPSPGGVELKGAGSLRGFCHAGEDLHVSGGRRFGGGGCLRGRGDGGERAFFFGDGIAVWLGAIAGREEAAAQEEGKWFYFTKVILLLHFRLRDFDRLKCQPVACDAVLLLDILLLIIKTKEGDIAVFEFVVFAFESVFAGLAGSGGTARGDEVVVADDLGFDEAFFKIGMNDAGALGGFHAVAEGPGADFLFACGKVGGEPEEVVGGANEEGDAGIGDAEGLEVFGGFGGFKVDEFRFDGSGDDADAGAVMLAGVGFDFLDVGVLAGVGEVAFRDIAGVEDALGAQEAKAFERNFFFVGKLEGKGGFVFVQMRKEAVDQFDILGGFLVAAAGFFGALFFLAFEGGEVGEDEFGIDDLDIAEGVNRSHIVNDVFVLEATHHVDDGIDFADIGEEFVAEALALAGPGDESGDVDEFDGGGNDAVGFGDGAEGFKALVRHLHHSDVWVDSAERIVG